MSDKPPKPRLRGRKIIKVDWGEFSDGRGCTTSDPHLYLDDGTILSFIVHETDIGEYGIEAIVVKG